MKMKTMMAAVCVACAAVAADEADEWAEWGGRIEVWPRDPGVFAVIDAQKRIDGDGFGRICADLQRTFSIKVQYRKGTAPEVRGAKAELARLGLKGAIWIVDEKDYPVVLSADEDGWGYLNVAALLADHPSEDVLGGRLVKETIRLFGFLHGVSDSLTMPGCVFKHAHGLAGLDGLKCKDISPEAYSKINNYLGGAGYRQLLQSSYLEACEQGWAPAPTNAVQRQIWDKVHALPKAPIRIKPETEKVRD